MNITMGMKPVDKNLKMNNSGKMDLTKGLSEEKRSREANKEEKAAGGVFR